jgi:hypothetical protein
MVYRKLQRGMPIEFLPIRIFGFSVLLSADDSDLPLQRRDAFHPFQQPLLPGKNHL